MFAIANDKVLDPFVTRIDESASYNLFCGYLRTRLTQLQHIAVLKDHDVLALEDPQSRCPITMSVELSMLAVYRHKELGSRCFDQNLQVLLTSVAGHVHPMKRRINYLCTTLIAVRNETRNRGFVSRNLSS